MDNKGKRNENHFSNRRPTKNKNYTKLYIIPTVLCILIALIIMASIFILKKGADDNTSGTDTSSATTEETSIPEENLTEAILSASQKEKAVKTGSLLLINSETTTDRALVFTTVQSLYPAKSSYQISGSDLYLTKDSKEAFVSMMDALYADMGKTEILLYNAFKKAQDEVSTSKDSSFEHDAGIAVDFRVYNPDTKATYPLTDSYSSEIYAWLLENAHKYGFIQRYPAEKENITGKNTAYQFRYVGVAHATYIKTENLCLEEYLQLLRGEHSSVTTALKITDGTNETFVYYVDATAEGDIQYKVLKDYSVTLSGDNQSGFIVTMTKTIAQ